jgi:hypothetical protein
MLNDWYRFTVDMDESNISDTVALIPRFSVPSPVPDNRQPHEKRYAVHIILASIVLERFAFYSLTINLVINLKSSELDWDPLHSTAVSLLFFGEIPFSSINWGKTFHRWFIGLSYISSVIFAVLSDAKLGREKTIFIGKQRTTDTQLDSYWCLFLSFKGFIFYLIGYALIILITNTDTHTLICSNSPGTHSLIINEQCGPQIIGTLALTSVY